MLSRIRPRLTYANVITTVCLFMLLGGGAYAASQLPKNSVGSKQIKKHAVTPSKVAKKTIRLFRGRRGRAGATNVTVRKTNLTLHWTCTPFGPGDYACSTDPTSATASCHSRERATGGGYGKGSDSSQPSIEETRPSPESGKPTGWTVTAQGFFTPNGPSPTRADTVIPVYAVCAAP